jgi:hypothetical protein
MPLEVAVVADDDGHMPIGVNDLVSGVHPFIWLKQILLLLSESVVLLTSPNGEM